MLYGCYLRCCHISVDGCLAAIVSCSMFGISYKSGCSPTWFLLPEPFHRLPQKYLALHGPRWCFLCGSPLATLASSSLFGLFFEKKCLFLFCLTRVSLQDTEEGGWERVLTTRNGGLSVERKFIGKNSGGRYMDVGDYRWNAAGVVTRRLLGSAGTGERRARRQISVYCRKLFN